MVPSVEKPPVLLSRVTPSPLVPAVVLTLASARGGVGWTQYDFPSSAELAGRPCSSAVGGSLRTPVSFSYFPLICCFLFASFLSITESLSKSLPISIH